MVWTLEQIKYMCLVNKERIMLENEELDVEEYALPSGVYQNYKSKAEENKSSAISLLLVGFIGTVFVLLSWFEKLPFSIGGSKNIMSHSVLFVFFVAFIILGILSIFNAKKYKKLISTEKDAKDVIYEYLQATFPKETLEENTYDTEEEAYFNRMEFMREKVKEQFAEEHYEETLLEFLLDEYYDELFG